MSGIKREKRIKGQKKRERNIKGEKREEWEKENSKKHRKMSFHSMALK